MEQEEGMWKSGGSRIQNILQPGIGLKHISVQITCGGLPLSDLDSSAAEIQVRGISLLYSLLDAFPPF